MEKNRYGALDYFKFILAILVVDIHYPLILRNESISYWKYGLINALAVPLFFAVSGFLFVKSGKYLSNKSSWNYIKRLLLLWLPWSAFMEVYNYLVAIVARQRDPLPFKDEIKEYLRRLIVADLQYWFVQKIILTVVLYLCIKWFFKEYTEIALCVFFAGLQIYAGEVSAFSGVFYQMQYGFYFLEGMIIAKYVLENRVKRKYVGFLIALLYLMSIGEMFRGGEQKVTATYTNMLLVPCILVMVLSIKGVKENVIFRHLSTWIYCVQGAAAMVAYGFNRYIFKIDETSRDSLWFLGTLVVSILSGVIVLFLQKCRYFRWTKYLM